MIRQLEAVFEHGVLRLLEPLSLPEMQRVLLTITDVPAPPDYNSRQAEPAWLREHGFPGGSRPLGLETSAKLDQYLYGTSASHIKITPVEKAESPMRVARPAPFSTK